MQVRLLQVVIVVLCLISLSLCVLNHNSSVARKKQEQARHVVGVTKERILRENLGLVTDLTQKYASRGEYECLTSERDLARDDVDCAIVYRECLRIISDVNKGPATDAKYGALRQENKDFGFCFSVLEVKKDLENFLDGLDEGSLSADFVLKHADKIEVSIRVKATELRKGFYESPFDRP
ncbi:MAG: hypothetical protein Q7S57_05705 [bacterium]|nr:hypothetical protein [bacterium]